VKAPGPDGVYHIVEGAFGANIDADVEMLKMGGSIIRQTRVAFGDLRPTAEQGLAKPKVQSRRRIDVLFERGEECAVF
jgi:hypothetical protein